MRVADFSISAVITALTRRLTQPADRKNLEASIEAELEKFAKHAGCQGLVVGVYKDGKSFIKGRGSVNKQGGAAPDAETIFQIGSVSKVLTASLLQILCDEGVVGMDATLGELIGPTVPLSQAAECVTLRQLVTHTAGFPSVPKPLAAKLTELTGEDDPLLDPYNYLGPQVMFDYLAETEDKRNPGAFEYSNYGVGLLGHVLELVTGKDLESLVREKILAPLGMNATGIVLTAQMQERLAQGYTAKGEPTPIWKFLALAGAGAFHSNARDMLSFIRAHVEEDAHFAASFKKMREVQSSGKTGIGWMQPTFFDRFFGNRQVVWHNGMVAGYAAYLSIDTQARSGVIVLANKGQDVTMQGVMLTRQVRTQSWALLPSLCSGERTSSAPGPS